MRSTASRSLDVDAVRHVLIARREELLRRHAATLGEERELLETQEPDLPDVAANRTAAALLDRLGDAELVQLRRISTALERLDAGSYGSCIVCGGPIAPGRLDAMPEADRCETCHNSH